ARIRDHRRGGGSVRGTAVAAPRHPVRGAGPARRRGTARAGPRGGGGRPAPPLLPADRQGGRTAGAGGGPAAAQRRRGPAAAGPAPRLAAARRPRHAPRRPRGTPPGQRPGLSLETPRPAAGDPAQRVPVPSPAAPPTASRRRAGSSHRQASRQPSWNRPRNTSVTRMNASAVPWPARTRRIIPAATALSHTPTPVGSSAVGRRQKRVTSSPMTRPAANGHSVSQKPASPPPSWWFARPIATNTSTQQKSAPAEAALRTVPG